MSFNSFAFTLLFALVLLCRYTFGRRKIEPGYLVVLLLASLLFYGWHIPAYLLIILTSTTIDFFAARGIAAEGASDRRRKTLLTISLVANLGMLAFFKYADFAIAETARLATMAGLDLHEHTLGLLLPMGISFYTFQSMSYTIDVYRRQVQPEASFWRFALYVSFFPQLVAGPIVRARDFLYQLPRIRQPRMVYVNAGVYLIIRGLFLKMVCADNIAFYVDNAWDDFAIAKQGDALGGVLLAMLFAGQIFCDFAGYSSIARGLAYLLGFRLPINFNNPYLAQSFSEFWRRWHITLSQWLRDYLYIPLGGNRVATWRVYFNLMLVMTLGGLWHGAGMPFILWGIVHGLGLCVERALNIHTKAKERAWTRWGWYLVVQATVLLTWVLFRSESLDQTLAFLSNTLTTSIKVPRARAIYAALFLLPLILMHVRGALVERKKMPEVGNVEKAFWAGLMLLGVITLYGESGAFIYFQF